MDKLKNTTKQATQQTSNTQSYDAKWAMQDPSTRGYSIGTHEYPDGLRVKEDLQHYVAFYINVRDKAMPSKGIQQSELVKNSTPGTNTSIGTAGVTEQQNLDIQNSGSSRISTQDAKAALTTVGNNAGKIAGIGTLIAGIGLGSGLKSIGGTVVKAAAAGILARTAVKMLDRLNLPDLAEGSTSRVKEVITLHVEERPSVKYGTNYTDKELGTLTGLLVQGSAAAAAGKLKSVEKEIQARFISELVKLPSLRGGGGTLSDLREISTKEKTNPFRETLFESVGYRAFNFRYRFYPKNKSETDRIKKIIDTFKIHMHPDLTTAKLFYIYPSEFDIQYFYKDRANPYVHNFARCALTDMSVEYGGEQYATFDDGSPVEIGLTLTFRELEQLNSESIKNYGY